MTRRRRRRGTGSIFQSAQGSWIAVVRLRDGSRKKRQATDYAGAQLALSSLKREYKAQLVASYLPHRIRTGDEPAPLRFRDPLPPAVACAICGRLAGEQRRLVRDHDHETGFFRGYLCPRCNLSLGAFEDDPELLERAAGYLRESRDRYRRNCEEFCLGRITAEGLRWHTLDEIDRELEYWEAAS